MSKLTATFKFKNGARVGDTITGYAGVIGGRSDYLTGCKQYGLIKEGLTKEGKAHDWVWFDESRLELVSIASVKIDEESDPGGPSPLAPEC